MKRILLTVVILLMASRCFASVETQKLIRQCASLVHQIEDIDYKLNQIKTQEETERIKDEDLKKLNYYKQYLEEDNPVPKDFGK